MVLAALEEGLVVGVIGGGGGGVGVLGDVQLFGRHEVWCRRRRYDCVVPTYISFPFEDSSELARTSFYLPPLLN